MPDSDTLQDLFVNELRDAYDGEKQLIKALRKMASAATHPELADAFTTHLEETNGQVALLEEVFEMLDMKPKGKHCAGLAGIIEEGGEAIEEMDKSPVLDAALIGGGKRAEHYEMAAYTTLIALANQLGHEDAVGKFQEILSQEIAADEKLDELATMLLPLAENGENAEGSDTEIDGLESADDEEEPAAAPSRNAPKRAAPTRKSSAKRTAR